MSLEVAAYYFPQYHADPRNDVWHGKGWTEWDLVRAARPRYPGHRQPIEPAWGHFDAADPHLVAREIDAAADHGITSFIYDTYWYEDGPFLQAALENGFLKAANVARLKFAVRWANHDWANIHPARLTNAKETLISGKVSRQAFDAFIEHVIHNYFYHPSYLKLGDCPYFSLFDLLTFVEGLGSVDAAKEALEHFHFRTEMAGHKGVHLNAVIWRFSAPGFAKFGGAAKLVQDLVFDSVSAGSFRDHYDLAADTFPRGSYQKAAQANFAAWETQGGAYGVPYIPTVTVGWDSSPRCCISDKWEGRGYPWLPVLEGNTPAAFRTAVEKARAFATRPGSHLSMITLSAWNEWTQGAYLLPDTHHGMAYLEAVKRALQTRQL